MSRQILCLRQRSVSRIPAYQYSLIICSVERTRFALPVTLEGLRMPSRPERTANQTERLSLSRVAKMPKFEERNIGVLTEREVGRLKTLQVAFNESTDQIWYHDTMQVCYQQEAEAIWRGAYARTSG